MVTIAAVRRHRSAHSMAADDKAEGMVDCGSGKGQVAGMSIQMRQRRLAALKQRNARDMYSARGVTDLDVFWETKWYFLYAEFSPNCHHTVWINQTDLFGEV